MFAALQLFIFLFHDLKIYEMNEMICCADVQVGMMG